ncbi:VanW family protein [Clostridium manihotivorum]|uniref:Vanomycin resistance protein VanB n=1 Tax=Clostridium manihotivorum TaxID=2320868 RepID=A0A410DUP5_9CLOT|nr:VanW family protein [Clostridium manihotivorum]QAA32795.1 vanomycin resistance protein VanB [Clostridium manihotivorum]
MNYDHVIETEKQKKRNLRPVYIITGIIGTILCIQGSIMYSAISKYNAKIYPETWIEDINVGGKTKEEAKSAIIEKHDNLIAEKIINIKVNDKNYNIDTSKLNMKYDYSKIVDEAFNVGRNDNILKKYSYIKSSVRKDFKLSHTYTYDVVDSIIKNIEQENNEKPVDATIRKNDADGFIINKEKYGYELDSQKLKQDIKVKLDNIEQEQNLLVQADLKRIDPSIKESDLNQIDYKISSFTTNFKSSNENRSTNISVASHAIDGRLLMPGDSFSFNDVVGERSAERGYKMAKVILNGKFVEDLGGGVCQVSTTLYNAVLRANIPSVQRTRHSLPSTYVGLGMDATVAYGLLDYKFKNTLSYPIYIESMIKDKNITFNVYANSSLSSKKYDIVNEVEGDKVKVFKLTYEGEKLVSRDLLYTDKITKTNG